MSFGNKGQQGIRRREEGGKEIQDHTGEDDGLVEDEADTDGNAGKIQFLERAGLLADFRSCIFPFHLAHQDQRRDHRQEGNGIDPVRPLLPQRGNHQPAQCRPDDGAGIRGDRLQSKCALQILARHNVGNQGLPGGAIKGDRDPIHSRDDVDPPDADGAKISEHPQRQGGAQHGGLGDEQHPPAVESIRHQPADERKQDDRDEPCQPHSADSQRLVGEGAQMPVDRPGLHLGAGNRH